MLQKQTLKQKTSGAVTTPRGPTVTTFRSTLPRITPTPVPRAPGTKAASPSFANFPASNGGDSVTPSLVPTTKRSRVRGSRKRLRRYTCLKLIQTSV